MRLCDAPTAAAKQQGLMGKVFPPPNPVSEQRLTSCEPDQAVPFIQQPITEQLQLEQEKEQESVERQQEDEEPSNRKEKHCQLALCLQPPLTKRSCVQRWAEPTPHPGEGGVVTELEADWCSSSAFDY